MCNTFTCVGEVCSIHPQHSIICCATLQRCREFRFDIEIGGTASDRYRDTFTCPGSLTAVKHWQQRSATFREARLLILLCVKLQAHHSSSPTCCIGASNPRPGIAQSRPDLPFDGVRRDTALSWVEGFHMSRRVHRASQPHADEELLSPRSHLDRL